MFTLALPSSIIETIFMEYFFLRSSSSRLLFSHSGLTSSSTMETSSDISRISTNPELMRLLASRIPDSCSGKITLSAPTLLSILQFISLEHFAITVLTPISLQSIADITLASRFVAIAMITTSTFDIPSSSNTSGSVTSAHLQKGISFTASSTFSSSISTASTSAPLLTSSFATALPYLPSPKTA